MSPGQVGTLVPDISRWPGSVHIRHNWTMVHPAIPFELPRTTLHIRTKVLSAISSADFGLQATLSLYMFFILSSRRVHVALPPLVLPLTRGSHGIAFAFMYASKMMHCVASIRSVSSSARDIPLMPQPWPPLS